MFRKRRLDPNLTVYQRLVVELSPFVDDAETVASYLLPYVVAERKESARITERNTDNTRTS